MAVRVKALAKYPIGMLHRAALRVGVVILPNHYYTPVADVHELRRFRRIWANRSAMTGVDMNVAAQADELLRMVKPYEPEYRGNAPYKEGTAKGFGP